jgi:hypothetical protein
MNVPVLPYDLHTDVHLYSLERRVQAQAYVHVLGKALAGTKAWDATRRKACLLITQGRTYHLHELTDQELHVLVKNLLDFVPAPRSSP